jgi:hypothetical protein
MKGRKIAAAVFFGLMLLFPVLTFALPYQSFSEVENRYLSEFPALSVQTIANRQFMDGFEDYASDHFVGRDTWVAAKGYSEYLLGKRENNGVFLCDDALIERLEEPNEGYTRKNIEGILAFSQTYGIKPFVMLIPSASDIQKEKLPKDAQTWDQKGYIDEIYEQLAANVKTIDAYGTLLDHKDEYIYYKTDHHWTTLGAWLVSQTASEAMGFDALDIDAIAPIISDQFYGTLYSKAGFRSISADEMHAYEFRSGRTVTCTVNDGEKVTTTASPYFPENLQKKDKYTYFLGENQPCVTLETNAGTGRKLLIFKDSYAHSFAPLLVDAYDEITLVDLRYTQDYEKYANPAEYDDVLMMYSVDVFAHQLNPAKLK